MAKARSEQKAETPTRGKNERKNRYIPGLARIKFEPDKDWTKKDALELYNKQIKALGAYELDKVYFEDCIVGMHTLPTESIDLIIADPPFGLKFSGKESLYNRNSDFVVDDYGEVKGDYGEFSKSWISELPRIMKPSASAYIFSGWTNLEFVMRALREVGLTILSHVIWEYQFGVFTRKKFVSSHYHLFFVVKNPKKYFFNRIEHYTSDVWTNFKRNYDPKKKKNGTKLPRKLIQRCIDFSSKPGDIILDPFMGNGTTAEAAKANYRHFIGFEINIKAQPLIEKNIAEISNGENYSNYKSRLPKPETFKDIYPNAWEIYNGELVKHDKEQ